LTRGSGSRGLGIFEYRLTFEEGKEFLALRADRNETVYTTKPSNPDHFNFG
jgi:hypothetical protein